MIFIGMEKKTDCIDDCMIEFDKVFTRINERFDNSSQVILENTHLNFSSVEEARQYFKSIPFSDWLNNAKGKYDI